MRRARVVIAVVAVLLAACTGVRVADQSLSAEYAWPAGQPHVRLERVVLLEGSARGAGKVLGLLGGRKEGGPFVRPYGVAWDGEDLLVTDPGAGRVARIGPDGRMALSPEGAVANPIGIARCAEGVLVSDVAAGKVALLGANLARVRWVAEGLDRPTGVACDDASMFVLETGKHRLLVLDPEQPPRAVGERGSGPGQFNFPTALAAAAGSFWLGDTLNFRVQRFDARSFAFLESFGHLGNAAGEMPRIKGLAVDRDGHLWISDAHLDQVSLYTQAGAFLMSLGRTGAEPGEFSFPAGVAAGPDGAVAVVDSFNRRIQVFRLVPQAEALP